MSSYGGSEWVWNTVYLYAGDRQNQLDLCGLQEYFLNKTYKSAREQVLYYGAVLVRILMCCSYVTGWKVLSNISERTTAKSFPLTKTSAHLPSQPFLFLSSASRNCPSFPYYQLLSLNQKFGSANFFWHALLSAWLYYLLFI